jgi:hypothetical protein
MNRRQAAQRRKPQAVESALLPENLVVSDGCVHRRVPRGRQVDRDGALMPDTSPVHGGRYGCRDGNFLTNAIRKVTGPPLKMVVHA